MRTQALGLRVGSFSLVIGSVLLLVGGACGGSDGTTGPSSGGASPGAGGVAAGGSGTGGSGVGGSIATGGAPGTGGAATGGAAGSGGASGAGGGSGGASSSGGSGSGGAPSTDECTRELLQGMLDAYLDALEAHDPSSLPLASSVKFTENAETSEIGEGGLWTTAGTVAHVQNAIDLEQCTVAAHAVIPDGATDVPVAIRIKVESAEIIEVETIVARPGDYTAVTSDPDAIIDIAGDVGWDVPVPEGQTNTREEIIAWMDKYFRLFPSGVCNVTSGCTRLENGGGNYNCGGGATCSPNQPGPGDDNLNPRLILADVEMGIGIGLTIYNGHTDMHMFKMIDGEVYGVQVILSQSGGESGWD